MGSADDALIDRIYEAAFLPDRWLGVLDDFAARTGSCGGCVFVVGEGCIPAWIATESFRDVFARFAAEPDTQRMVTAARLPTTTYPGFLRDIDIVAPEAMAADPVQLWLREYGLGWQVATTIPMPTNESARVAMLRRYEDGTHDEAARNTLDGLRPHLARATLIAARLGLERARAAVATLEALRLPAAVLSSSGRTPAANPQFEASPEFVAGAHGRLLLADRYANGLFAEALAARKERPFACSLPIARSEGRPPTIVHLLPLRSAACDLMGGDILVVLTAMHPQANVADAPLLCGLFDLTPREAVIAAALAAGLTLKQAAEAQGIRISTARSYFEAVLRKTGAGQQSQLVALLKGCGSPEPADRLRALFDEGDAGSSSESDQTKTWRRNPI